MPSMIRALCALQVFFELSLGLGWGVKRFTTLFFLQAPFTTDYIEWPIMTSLCVWLLLVSQRFLLSHQESSIYFGRHNMVSKHLNHHNKLTWWILIIETLFKVAEASYLKTARQPSKRSLALLYFALRVRAGWGFPLILMHSHLPLTRRSRARS